MIGGAILPTVVACQQYVMKETEMAVQVTEPESQRPVLDLLVEMTAASMARSNLDPQALLLVRIAALVAMDAPPLSYLVNLRVAGDVGLTAEQVQGVLLAVAPIVGTTRIVTAGSNIKEAMGIGIAVAEAEEAAIARAVAEAAGGDTPAG
jgi:hypothetical protein